MGKYLYMAVTADDFELPIAVEDSLRELAKKFDIDSNSLSHSLNNNYSGKVSGRRFVKVKNL
ncbi:hypothetical protein [Clostridium saccharoperbutylacetonicum]|uniref:hypothetical protein n=1 Tax=Clostridium saccharoperbutylacetonicum TaxID=36745 RepID=UPI000983E315|nr:hypothetical protein [Clostridium saccharoperbutylacetonicum]AQR93353.1 hypothetical protein CLSAP_06510 [Clostridium saccharoperbutylacetonicum]AQR93362.1 hypothetical protein CLSAP_06600 [Clostridium saccharoperbutylacetonicum]NSB29059.1 hypothetical protein [Clostridium saccharoperbutylacetonicum]NSB34770.1 hypothetical protein [Clostridium saccharoperbutylacetonicum]NSB34783.1 hypothetical protein [Clostridium saccharoperbutylacetonicum]